MEGISIAKLLVIGVLVVLLFGTNKLRSLGGDLGAAIKGFKKAMSDEQPANNASSDEPVALNDTTHHKE
ncbi:Sec-independent protein translocase subunit TatA [Pectobacteriaceae bacterium CE70]|uniref:Sec-independent protein translocase subunit TatA n=1 Tax=Brenneria uluponensis TaxID=3057057 RepID=UPI0028E22263|nr:Sec-independent protein translocase subunit TatA [Brenneria ulupoensis]WJV63765.1 Sec-independent protein translocase subunit TatA [Pectobacteriaceae bacterium C52]WJV68162.1 Sec-independent protein translocase subunit TatA [Pectobacteriaceae bacterium CE70]WJY12101.1 Sec-independent protein translocase subunit TatA [Pectobacteriaceae bacterium C80]